MFEFLPALKDVFAYKNLVHAVAGATVRISYGILDCRSSVPEFDFSLTEPVVFLGKLCRDYSILSFGCSQNKTTRSFTFKRF